MGLTSSDMQRSTGNHGPDLLPESFPLGEFFLRKEFFQPVPSAGVSGIGEQADFETHMGKVMDFLRLLPWPLQVFDGSGTTVMVNKALMELFAISGEDEIVGRFNILSHDTPTTPEATAFLRRVFSGETGILSCVTIPLSLDYYSRFGIQRREDIFSQSVFIPVKGPGNDVRYVVLVRTDISKRKKAEDKLCASEQRLRALLEDSSDMIQVLDEKGTLTYISPSMEKILGYDPKEPLGDSVFRIIHPDDLPDIQNQFARLSADPDRPLKVVCRCRHKNGTWRFIETWAKNNLANPAIRGIVLNIRDITDHVLAQERAQTSELKFRSIVEQSRDGITIIDDTGTVIIFNRAQEKISGIPASEAMGKKIWDVQYRCMAAGVRASMTYRKFRATYQAFLREGTGPWLDRIIDAEMVRPDGVTVYQQTRLFALQVGGTTLYAS
ncbi:MAG: PAS domain S-box protein, partial [Chitinispirillaceae bacterium]|nr:PAS domain S-box protein [Chitinispirillaceae bacterium]